MISPWSRVTCAFPSPRFHAVSMSATEILAGQIVVILGGSGGIGAATAWRFAAAGARVAVVARSDVAKAQAVAEALPGSGHRAYAAAIEDSAALRRLAEDVEKDLGGA